LATIFSSGKGTVSDVVIVTGGVFVVVEVVVLNDVVVVFEGAVVVFFFFGFCVDVVVGVVGVVLITSVVGGDGTKVTIVVRGK
jgi:hypothetical protein